MPKVIVEKILSVSSEDPAHPAINLLKSDTHKKWKCKPGEKQASVILQLKQDTLVDGVDIGNENSAFVEVLVGKSTSLTNDFQVLLVASSMMTLKESKDGTNTSAVRFFKKENFNQSTTNEKWDRVKIVCTQPFNKHVQYGLSFVVLHSTSNQSVEAESSSSLGKFTLKEQDEEDKVSVGSWFAKRKDPPPPVPQGAAASIRDASSPALLAIGNTKKPTPKRPKNTNPKNGEVKPTKDDSSKQTQAKGPLAVKKAMPAIKMSIDDEDSPADDTDADSTYSPNKDRTSVLSDDDVIPSESDEEGSRKREKRPKRNKMDNKNTTVMNGGSTSKRKANTDDSGKAKHTKMDRETKPFNRLLEGVVFAISGYQNPSRGELRSKACAMGAKYRPDWDNTCTHLICAFVNTPKFNQVRGRGKIVKKDWIEECFNRRRRLPWRRFALDRYDIGTSSEEEVWEEGSVPTTSSTNAATANTIASGVNRRRVSSGSDTEEEIERVRARQVVDKPNTQKTKVDEPKKQPKKTPEKKSDPFGDDTDMDSEGESPAGSLPLPPLPSLFNNIVFHIGSDVDEEERRKLKRYIIAYKGCVVDDMEGSVEYVITRSPDTAAEVSEEFGVGSISPEWVWECSNAGELIPSTEYLL